MRIPTSPPGFNQLQKDTRIRERSFRYMGRDDVRAFLQSVNDRYLPWHELAFRPLPAGVDLLPFWFLVKTTRELTMHHVRIFDAKELAFKFNISVSDSLQQKLRELDMSCRGLLGTGPIVPEKDRRSYLVSSLMEEAIASSQLEGAATTRKVAKDMLRSGRKPQNRDERMILNNYLAMNRILELKGKRLTPRIIRDLQASLTHETLDHPEWEGSFRDNDDVVVLERQTGKVLHTPPPHKDLIRLMERYCDFANSSEGGHIHPIVKASILHYLMGYIHPFEDGNGRTARAIMYWYLLSQGYWLFHYMAVSRVIKAAPVKYARAYLHSGQDENDMTYFIQFQIGTIELAVRGLGEYVHRKQEERKRMYDFLQISGIDERKARILSEFAQDSERVMSIHEVQENFGVVYQTARTDLLGLVSLGFLQKKSAGKKLLFFRSPDFDRMTQKRRK